MIILGIFTFLAFLVMLILTIVALFRNRKKALKYGLWTLGLFVLSIVSIGIGGENTVDSDTGADKQSQKTSQTQKVDTQIPEAAVIKITSIQLSKAYNANEVAADQKYKKKVMLVCGIIKSIDKDFMNNIILNLNSGNQFLPVRANLSDGQEDKSASLSKGNQIILKCTGGGFVVGSSVLNKCIIEQVGE